MASTDTAPDAGTLAAELFAQLTAGTDFNLPAVDLDGPDFQIAPFPPVTGTSLTEADLTSRKVGGSGMFDALMDAFRSHLQQEFEKSRLTGAQYAEVYISNSATALSAAVQYLLSKDQAHWQGILAQRQAQMAEIQLVTARIGLEETKVRLATTRIQAKSAEADYALKKLQLAATDAGWELTKAQTAQVEYQTAQMMPAQLVGLTKDNEVKSAQITGMTKDNLVKDAQIVGMGFDNQVKSAEVEKINFEVASLLPAQLTSLTKENEVKSAQILGINKDNQVKDAQVAKITFEVSQMMPAQMAGMTKDNEIKDAQKIGIAAETAMKTAQKDQVLYETSAILPAQKKKIDTEEAVLTYQLSALFPAQVAGHTADTAGKIFNNDFILPETLANLKEQLEGNRAKTMDTRTDGTTVKGTVGMQNSLYKQQIDSYKRDAESKAVKMMLDTWVAQRSTDEAVTAPTAMDNAAINAAFGKLKTNLAL